MATGAGKTRTVIALVDLLMRADWVKRVLFLADRVALVNQAASAFKAHLPDAAPVNLVTERTSEGRVFVSTYPTMMGLIDGKQEGKALRPRPFRPDRHRRGAPLGLPEVPRDLRVFRLAAGRADRDAEGRDRPEHLSLFDLEDGVPTDAYSLDEAVADGYLVPPKAVSVPLKFQRSGHALRRSDARRKRTSGTCWNGARTDIPDSVDAAEVNKWLFNEDTVDKVLAHLMQNGIKVAGGDRLGKTIIFAKNQDHAEFIEKRFNADYPHFAGHFARVITHKTGATRRA